MVALDETATEGTAHFADTRRGRMSWVIDESSLPWTGQYYFIEYVLSKKYGRSQQKTWGPASSNWYHFLVNLLRSSLFKYHSNEESSSWSARELNSLWEILGKSVFSSKRVAKSVLSASWSTPPLPKKHCFNESPVSFPILQSRSICSYYQNKGKWVVR